MAAVGGAAAKPSEQAELSAEELHAIAAAARKGSKGEARSGNTVSGAGEETQSDTSPTASARETAQSAYAEQKATIEERLADNEDYQTTKGLLAAAEQYAADFDLVELNALWAGDGKLTLDDIKAVANDEHRPEDVRAAAKRMLSANRDVKQGVFKGDNLARTDDVNAYVESLRAKLSALQKEVTAEVKAERAEQAATAGAPKGGAANGSASNQTAATGSSQSTPKPAASPLPGLEGANADLGANSDWLQSEIIRLGKEAAADPSKAASINAEIAVKTNQLQQLTNMQSQLMQMMSNLSKLWSDVAMNSIRNLK